MRVLLGLLAAVVLIGGVVGQPMQKEEPRELRDAATVFDGSCWKMALSEYRLVLSDPLNRADHFYLAQTYQALAELNLVC